MTSSEKLAIAAHLHVLLRRKTGRVTDTEWMASNAEYAAEIARFAKAKAIEHGHSDLSQWAEKLENTFTVADLKRPQALPNAVSVDRRDRQSQTLAAPDELAPTKPHFIDTERADLPESGVIVSTYSEAESDRLRKLRELDAQRYVKGLR